MKIAILTYWGDKGGVYIHVMNIATRVSKLPDVDLHIVALSEKSCTDELFGGTAHFLKRAKSAGANYFYNPFLIRNKIMEIDPDLIHIHTTINSQAIAALMLPKRYPIIVTIHQSIEDDIRNRLPPSTRRRIKLKIEPYLEKQLLKRASQTIVPYPLLGEHVNGMIQKDKIRYIPNGVDTANIQNLNTHTQLEHPCILYVGRLVKIKAVDILIKAIPIIKNLIKDITLYIIGSGHEEGKLRSIVNELNIEKNVTFLGFIPQYEIYPYYRSTDVFVNPHKDGAFSLTTIEALACGTAVITSNVGGISWIMEDGKTGLLFEFGDVNSLAERAITLLQSKELRKKMGEAGLEKVKEFSWDKIADKTVNLYREVISEAGAK